MNYFYILVRVDNYLVGRIQGSIVVECNFDLHPVLPPELVFSPVLVLMVLVLMVLVLMVLVLMVSYTRGRPDLH